MDFTKLLEYQKVDLEYKQHNDEIVGNKDFKTMKAKKEEFNAAKQAVGEAEALAESVMNAYNGALEYMKANADKIEAVVARLTAGELNEDEEKAAVDELETLKAALNEWEKKAAALKANADKAIADFTEAQKTGKTARTVYADSKAKYEEFKKGKEQEYEKIKNRLAELQKTVEPKVFEVYKQITAEGKYPAFVPAIGDDASPACGACGMGLSGTAKSDLKNQGYCRCETCRRIIFKQE